MIEDEFIAIYMFIAVGMGAALAAVNRWPAVLAIFVLGIVELQLETDLRMVVFGFQVSPSDLLAAMLALAGGWRFLAKPGHDVFDVAALAFLTICVLFFVRGAATYGLEASANGFRHYFYLSSAIFLLVSYPWPKSACDTLVRFVFVAGVALTGLALVFWTFPEFDLAAIRPTTARLYEAQRVLPANCALLMAQAGLIALTLWLRGRLSPGIQLSCVVILPVMLFLYHRSVWTTLAVTVLMLTLVNWRVAWRVLFPAGGVAFFFALILFFGVGFGREDFFAEIGSAVSEPLSGQSTLDWRVEGWQILARRAIAQGPVTWLFGSGFGVGYERYIGNSLIVNSPHNFYIETFIIGGAILVVAWLALPLLALRGLARGEVAEGLLADRNLALAWLTMIIVYGIPYSPSPEQSVLIVMAIGMARRAAIPVRAQARTA